MEWSDEGIVLAARPHGETAAILSLLTARHGRHAGLVPGGAGRRNRPLLQPGNRLRVDWRARLPEHLGHFRCELLDAAAARLLDEPSRLAALASAVAVADAALPEREPHPAAFAALESLVRSLSEGDAGWPERYVRYELGLLAELGFGLALDRCAVTGARTDLTHVSPKTGRAVSRDAAERYRDRLLPLPAFLAPGGGATGPAEIRQGLALTGHFLDRHVFVERADSARRGEPAARARFIALLGKA